MSHVLVAVVALALGALLFGRRRGRTAEPEALPTSKILFPFVGRELSERALQATLRLAKAEGAVVVPAYLTTVPMPLALDAPVGRACDEAFSVFEAIEQQAARAGVPVDTRVVRGRNVRHGLRETLDEVPGVSRVVVAAASNGHGDGFSVDDVAWLLRNAPGEVVVIRPTRRSPSGRTPTAPR